MNVPFSLIGGTDSLAADGYPLERFLSGRFHRAIRHRRTEWGNPVIQNQFTQARRYPLYEAILQGSVSRLRPVVMTALMAMLGLLPAALSTSVGSETVKPFATVIIGGLLTAHCC